jgi:hypothetical protein
MNYLNSEAKCKECDGRGTVAHGVEAGDPYYQCSDCGGTGHKEGLIYGINQIGMNLIFIQDFDERIGKDKK